MTDYFPHLPNKNTPNYSGQQFEQDEANYSVVGNGYHVAGTAGRAMGQGGLILLANKTPYSWLKTYQHSYQMNSWDGSFPEVITPGSTVRIYVEWDEGAFKHREDDGGEITYSLQGSDNLSFQVRAHNYNLNILFLNLSTGSNAKGSVLNLGWQHDGSVGFLLMGSTGSFHSWALGSNRSWMQYVDGGKKLSELTIPGTHDTCTYRLNDKILDRLSYEDLSALLVTFAPLVGALSIFASIGVAVLRNVTQCQDLTVADQLDRGIRFLDMRLRSHNNALWLYHGDISLDLNFADVLNSCYEFLRNNRSETIIMSIAAEKVDGTTIQDLVNTTLSSNSQYWYRGTAMPELQTVRGKLVLLRRFRTTLTNVEMGIDATVWPANKTTPEPTTNNFYIQDRYSPYRTWELYDKFNNNVRPCLDRAAGDMGKAIQYINFTSGTEGVYPRSLATGYMVDFGGTNKLLSEYMDRIATFNRYGIIPMDFPEYPYKYSLIHQLVYSNSFDRYSTQIHDGCIYAIHPFRAPGRCLDVRANSSDDGAGVIISRPHGGKNQQWRVEPAGDGYYFLHPQNAPEKVLDVLGKKSANLTPTIIYENKSTDNQKWKIEAGKSEYFVLKPKHAPNTALELYEGNIADGVLATLYELNESTAQGWRFVMVGFKAGGIYTIQPRCAAHSNLSVRDGGSVDNSAVVIGPITNAESQKWEITPCGDGYYYLKPLNARDKLLDVKGNKSDNRTPTIIHSNNSQDNQKWKIDSCGNGYFTLRPKSALGKALELYESNSANGTAATLFDVNGSVAQQWNLNGV